MAIQKISIKIANAVLPDSEIDDLVELTVDQDLFLPAMLSMTFQDKLTQALTYTYIDNPARFKLGSPVEVALAAADHDEKASAARPVRVFTGEITSVEPMFTTTGKVQVCVRAYDRLHRLTHAKRCRSFEQITLEDIVRKIAQENQLSVRIGEASLKSMLFESFFQYNQNDWEFLLMVARMVSAQVYIEGQVLYIQPLNYERAPVPLALTWGKDLSSFEPRVSVNGLIAGSSATGWNPSAKRPLTGKAVTAMESTSLPLPGLGEESVGAMVLKSVFSSTDDYEASQPLVTVGQASMLANAAMSWSESDYVRANGYCQKGNPNIQVGRKAQIKNIGARFSGSYYITKAVHQVRGGRYTVNFAMAGSGPNSLPYLLAPDSPGDSNKVYGMVIGLVTNNNDPQNLGRVRVRYPWMPIQNGLALQSGWARVVSPWGGKDRGMYFIPEIDDEVLVAFEQGDFNFPYIVGSLWNSLDKPPVPNAEIVRGGLVNRRVLRSRTGHMLVLSDEAGKRQIVIQDATGKNQIILSSDDQKVTVTLNAEKDLSIVAGGNLTLESKNGSVTIKAMKKIQVETREAVAVDAKAGLKMNTNGKLELKGSAAELSAASLEFKATGQIAMSSVGALELKGSVIKIN